MFLRLLATLGLNATEYELGLKRVQSLSSRAGRSIESEVKGRLAAAFSVAAITAATKSLIDFGGRIHDNAKKIGVTTDEMQELNYAAELTGAHLGNITRAFKDLAKSRDAALGGDKEKKSLFSLAGLDEAALKSKSLHQIFMQIAKTFQTTDFGESEMTIVTELLGKSGVELLPAFQEGFSLAADEAHRLGIILENDVIKRLDDAGDSVTRLAARMRGVLAVSVGFVANRLGEILDYLDIAIGGSGALIQGFISGKGGPIERYKLGSKLALQHITDILDARIKAEQDADPGKPAKPDRAKADEEAVRKALGNRNDGKAEKVPTLKAPQRTSDSLLQVGNFLGEDPGRHTRRQLDQVIRQLTELNRKAGRADAIGFPI